MIINYLGNVSVGKSTLRKATAEFIKSKLTILPHLEIPEDYRSNKYWAAAYSGEKPEPMKMQFAFTTQYMQTLNNLRKDDALILDQCFYTLPFIWTMRKLKMIPEIDYLEYYKRWFVISEILRDKLKLLTNIILLDDPKVIFKRLQERGREEEKGMTLEFIETMDFFYRSQAFQDSFGPQNNLRFIDMKYVKKGEVPDLIKEIWEWHFGRRRRTKV